MSMALFGGSHGLGSTCSGEAPVPVAESRPSVLNQLPSGFHCVAQSLHTRCMMSRLRAIQSGHCGESGCRLRARRPMCCPWRSRCATARSSQWCAAMGRVVAATSMMLGARVSCDMRYSSRSHAHAVLCQWPDAINDRIPEGCRLEPWRLERVCARVRCGAPRHASYVCSGVIVLFLPPAHRAIRRGRSRRCRVVEVQSAAPAKALTGVDRFPLPVAGQSAAGSG